MDVVLNSLAGDFIERSLEVTAKGGTFLELGRSGIWTPEEVAAQTAGCRLPSDRSDGRHGSKAGEGSAAI